MSWWSAIPVTRMFTALNRWRPKRDKKSDGRIGDEAHAKRKSDHNPDPTSKPPGVVRAGDVDDDGIHLPTLIASLIVHPATNYIISHKVIYSRSRKFRRARYTGSNPHTEHLHNSTRKGHERDFTAYCWLEYVPDWKHGIRKGDHGPLVMQLQAFLIAYGYTLTFDGGFGDATDKALRSFQTKRKITVDGVAGPKTQAKLRAVA